MPHYFFDTHDGEDIRDEEGQECIDFDDARVLAMKSLAEIVRWLPPNGSDRQSVRVLVRDEAGQPVYTTTLTLDGRRLGPEADRMCG